MGTMGPRDDRFDGLTRMLGADITRRRLLQGVAGLAFGTRSPSSISADDPTATPTPASAVPPGRYPTSLADAFGTCPADDEGGDPNLYVLKNRVAAAAPDAWIPVTVRVILALPEPEGTTRYLANWPEAAWAVVDDYLGEPVRSEAFTIGARRSGGETTTSNAGEYGSDGAVDDYLIFAAAGETFDRAVVTEITPQVRVQHPAWTLKTLEA